MVRFIASEVSGVSFRQFVDETSSAFFVRCWLLLTLIQRPLCSKLLRICGSSMYNAYCHQRSPSRCDGWVF